jgi:hypothetical protein
VPADDNHLQAVMRVHVDVHNRDRLSI